MAIGAILGQRSGVQTVNGQQPDLNGNVELTPQDVNAMPVNGGKFTGNVDMNNNKITGLPNPMTNNEPETLGHTKQNYVAKANVVNNFTTTEDGYVADARTVAIQKVAVTKTDLLKSDASLDMHIFGHIAVLNVNASLDESKPFSVYGANLIATYPEELGPAVGVSLSPAFRNGLFCSISIDTGKIYAQPFSTVTKESQFCANISWVIR